MRRMLDPKTIGGGGGESIQLYRHHIYLSYRDNYGNYGSIYFDYDSTNAEQFTLDTLINAMEGKDVVCSGFLIISTKRIVINMTITNNQLQAMIYSIEESRPSIGNFNLSKDYVTIQDKVYLIN